MATPNNTNVHRALRSHLLTQNAIPWVGSSDLSVHRNLGPLPSDYHRADFSHVTDCLLYPTTASHTLMCRCSLSDAISKNELLSVLLDPQSYYQFEVPAPVGKPRGQLWKSVWLNYNRHKGVHNFKRPVHRTASFLQTLVILNLRQWTPADFLSILCPKVFL